MQAKGIHLRRLAEADFAFEPVLLQRKRQCSLRHSRRRQAVTQQFSGNPLLALEYIRRGRWLKRMPVGGKHG
ncbi:hypothetical protein SDC9_200363 [bioreactor metagenome]|uniref:Uncharacterized protein n=1 Tax=bioreactor metagenome TaxID=1076179 RepID=A0A645IN24_9ZZZZ